MTKSREAALFSRCDDLVCELARGCPTSTLEWEDRLMEARLGFLLGLRTYHRVAGVLELWPYLAACARERIYAAQRALNRQRGAESRLSLDRPLPGGESMAAFFPSLEDSVTQQVEMRDFINRLEPTLRAVAWMGMAGYTQREMAARLHRAPTEVEALRRELWRQWTCYGEDGLHRG